MNYLLTNVAYVLVILQPLMWNLYLGANTTGRHDRGVFGAASLLSLAWCLVNLSAKLQVFSHLPLQTISDSIYAGPVCTKRDHSHLYWKWEASNYRDMNANMFMYLAVWFLPALITDHRRTMIMIIASALVGAYLSYAADSILIFTAAWCYISVPTVLLIFSL